MIFRQYREIVEGKKTQTRRICGDKQLRFAVDGTQNAYIFGKHGRIIYQTDHTYAVVPGRGKSGILVQQRSNHWVYYHEPLPENEPPPVIGQAWLSVRIRIFSIRREPLQSITEEDAKAEGVDCLEVAISMNPDLDPECLYVPAYKHLWNSINNRPDIRWEDNPDVFVYTFECVLE